MGYDIAPEETDKTRAHELMLRQQPQKGLEGVKKDYKAMISLLYVGRMLDVPPEQNAIPVIQRLRNSGKYALYIVTSRSSSSENPEIQATGKWLEHYSLRFDAVISAGDHNKREALKSLSPLLFVDDSASKLYEIFEDPEVCTRPPSGLENTYFGLFRQKSNRHVEPRGLIGTIDGWLELESKVYELTNRRLTPSSANIR